MQQEAYFPVNVAQIREIPLRAPQPLIADIVLLWLAESRLADAVLELLAPDGIANHPLELGVVRTERSTARRSVSLIENRQVRSLPSAVRRMRLQSAQKGSDTGLMKPSSPRPSWKPNTRAVACGLPRALLERVDAIHDRADLLAGQHLVARPGVVAVERHELDEAHLVARGARANSANGNASSSVKPRSATAFT